MTNQQAINLLKGLEQSLDDYCELNDEGKTAFGMAIMALELFGNAEQLPSAQPERKTGKWNFIGDQMFECTECGTCYTQGQFHQMRVRITDSEFPKFCPNCGARMMRDKL